MISFLRCLTLFGGLLIALPTLAQPLVYVTDPGSNTLTVINSGTNTILRKLNNLNKSRAIAISPDGQRVYVATTATSSHGAIAVLDGSKIANTGDNPLIKTLAVGGDPIALAYDASANLLYVADADTSEVNAYKLKDINADDPEPADHYTLPDSDSLDAMALSPDGQTLALASKSSQSITLFNLRALAANAAGESAIALNSEPRALRFSATGDALWIATKDGFAVYSLTSGSVNKVAVTHGTTSVAVATRQGKVYFGADDAKVVYVYTPGQSGLPSIAANGSVSGLSLSADGTRLYVVQACQDCGIDVISTANNQVLRQIHFGTAPASAGQFAGPGDIYAPNAATSGALGEQLSGSVLANDYKSRALSYALVLSPDAGTLNFNASGDYAYTPPSGFSGVARFVWQATASGGTGSPTDAVSRPVTQTLEISPAITSIDDQTADPDTTLGPLSFTLSGSKPFQIVLKSSYSDLVAADQITVSAGCGTTSLSCSLNVPVKNVENGHTLITLTAVGPDGLTTATSFNVTVGNGDNGGDGSLAWPMLAGLLALLLAFALRRRTHDGKRA